MSRDGEPKDPWLENFKAWRAAMDKKFDAMDKKLADSYRQLEEKPPHHGQTVHLHQCQAYRTVR
jgi:hypothetical protein